MIQLAFGIEYIQATAERELLKVQQTDSKLYLYLAEFKYLVANVNWNKAAQKNALRHGLSD
jgi:hypothetical protein